ncbi:uncharacterized protein N0V89_011814 [Didymosphaeria variabile]|uniref:Kinesin motor domain-containing protein n=1 Tax=Didymosphaeria variabile TaxID=1932322 RepID=A0A9W9C637_9PLEO|nr:uncharacterized protein N0V89_011814 [Didymosphaeria variabile]KAJ4345679.1 hypothetical protein N0V89_011814 [Didymosphaeria variabile]
MRGSAAEEGVQLDAREFDHPLPLEDPSRRLLTTDVAATQPPSMTEIYDALPPDGLCYEQLLERFEDRLETHDAWTFARMLASVGHFDRRTCRVMPNSRDKIVEDGHPNPKLSERLGEERDMYLTIEKILKRTEVPAESNHEAQLIADRLAVEASLTRCKATNEALETQKVDLEAQAAAAAKAESTLAQYKARNEALEAQAAAAAKETESTVAQYKVRNEALEAQAAAAAKETESTVAQYKARDEALERTKTDLEAQAAAAAKETESTLAQYKARYEALERTKADLEAQAAAAAKATESTVAQYKARNEALERTKADLEAQAAAAAKETESTLAPYKKCNEALERTNAQYKKCNEAFERTNAQYKAMNEALEAQAAAAAKETESTVAQYRKSNEAFETQKNNLEAQLCKERDDAKQRIKGLTKALGKPRDNHLQRFLRIGNHPLPPQFGERERSELVVDEKGGEVTLHFNDTQHRFQFDHIFDSMDDDEVTATFHPYIEHVADGGLSVIMTDGPSASGKSHTLMCGRHSIAQEAGRILLERAEDGDAHIKIKAVEMLQEETRIDWMKPSEREQFGIVLEDEAYHVTSEEGVRAVLQHIEEHRTVTGTNMNSKSSRKHLRIEMYHGPGRLVLLDVCGAERPKDVGMADEHGTLHINRTRSDYQRCIQSLRTPKGFYSAPKQSRVSRRYRLRNALTFCVARCVCKQHHEEHHMSARRGWL